MSTLRLAGTLWIMAGVACAGLLSFVLIGERINDLGALLANLALPARVLGGALVAFLIGGLLLTRPGPNVVRWSSLAGIAWLIAFGPLVVTTVAAALGGYESRPRPVEQPDHRPRHRGRGRRPCVPHGEAT